MRIAPLDPTTATGTTKQLLDGVQKGLGATPNLFRVAAQSPAALEALVSLFGAVGKGRLDARTRESVALAVSEFDACDYCLSAHSALGKRAGLDDEDLAKARRADADDPRRAAILHLGRALVETRGRVDDAALVEVRRAGLSDGEIVEVVANVALTIFTNYLNELAATEIDFPVVHHAPR